VLHCHLFSSHDLIVWIRTVWISNQTANANYFNWVLHPGRALQDIDWHLKSKLSIMHHCQLCSCSTNWELFEMQLNNRSSHCEKYCYKRKPSRGWSATNKLTSFAVSRDEGRRHKRGDWYSKSMVCTSVVIVTFSKFCCCCYCRASKILLVFSYWLLTMKPVRTI